jgi:hypothetical protein
MKERKIIYKGWQKCSHPSCWRPAGNNGMCHAHNRAEQRKKQRERDVNRKTTTSS